MTRTKTETITMPIGSPAELVPENTARRMLTFNCSREVILGTWPWEPFLNATSNYGAKMPQVLTLYGELATKAWYLMPSGATNIHEGDIVIQVSEITL